MRYTDESVSAGNDSMVAEIERLQGQVQQLHEQNKAYSEALAKSIEVLIAARICINKKKLTN